MWRTSYTDNASTEGMVMLLHLPMCVFLHSCTQKCHDIRGSRVGSCDFHGCSVPYCYSPAAKTAQEPQRGKKQLIKPKRKINDKRIVSFAKNCRVVNRIAVVKNSRFQKTTCLTNSNAEIIQTKQQRTF